MIYPPNLTPAVWTLVSTRGKSGLAEKAKNSNRNVRDYAAGSSPEVENPDPISTWMILFFTA
jgi:hypothetical protein